jgi:hypothetical protein
MISEFISVSSHKKIGLHKPENPFYHETLQNVGIILCLSFFELLPPFFFPQGGKVILLPPWGKAGLGVKREE